MGKLIDKRNGVAIFEYEAPKYRNIFVGNGVIAYGMCYKLYEWLRDNGNVEEGEVEEVMNNTSGLRHGNEIHIHDDYKFDWEDDELYISYLYYHNGTVWAVLLDKANDTWYGEFEL